MFVEIGIQKVRMVFTPTIKPGSFRLHQDCGMGCKCESHVAKCTPSVESSARMILCFNDATGQGLNGWECGGKAICEGPDIWIYEIDAKLKEQRPDPPPVFEPGPPVPQKPLLQPRPASPDCPF